MSSSSDTLFHPINKNAEKTWSGFSWPAFFFGFLWLVAKGLWTHVVIWLALAIMTMGWGAIVLSFVYGFIGNDLHKTSLLKKGYLTEDQINSAHKSPPAAGMQKVASAETYQGEKVLDNDLYRLFLIKKYSIEKNDVLGKYIVGDSVFLDLDGAVSYCDQKENIVAQEIAKKDTVVSSGKIGTYNYDFKEYLNGRVVVSFAQYSYHKEYKDMLEATKKEGQISVRY